MAAVQLAARLNLPPEGSNYEVFNMSDHDEYFAMKVGKLDGYVACDPWGSMAVYEKTGYIMESDVPSRLPEDQRGNCCAYTMRKAFVEEHPALAKRMIIAPPCNLPITLSAFLCVWPAAVRWRS